jgi:hypothetical protein
MINAKDMDELKYNITMSEHLEPSYIDGFKEGYSKGFQDAWECMLERIHSEREEQEELLRRESEVKTNPGTAGEESA